MTDAVKKAARLTVTRKWAILGLAMLLVVAAVLAARGLSISTKLEALMPEDAVSVRTLGAVMEKAGSFASIQVVMEGDDTRRIEEALFILEAVTRRLPWSESVQYFEDIAVLERHKLLQLSVPQLEKLETRLEREMLAATAREFQHKTGIPLNIHLSGAGISVSSAASGDDNTGDTGDTVDANWRDSLLQPVRTEKRFTSDDGRSHALVIWPKPGYEGLAEAKKMVADIAAIIAALELNDPGIGLRVGIAGRIRNKVAQFDAVIRDVTVGLGSSVTLIILLLIVGFRSLIAVPVILLPLVIGITWTIGLTALVVGGLNLVTIFLALILFGLGVDFGIHNFSRYAEARAAGLPHMRAIELIVTQTGAASLVAGMTTAAGFFALLLTEFRAFREFGFIAGSGILLTFLAMYTVFPALLSVVEKRVTWARTTGQTVVSSPVSNPRRPPFFFHRPYATLAAFLPMILVAVFSAPQLSFEKDFKNIQAPRSPDHQWATARSKSIFKGGHDRAVLVVDTLDEVEAIEAYFEAYAKQDTASPTIAGVTSIRNFVPDKAEQADRLAVINRMWDTLDKGTPIPEALADKTDYLRIGMLETADLPQGLQRVFLGGGDDPGYLMYIFNAVSMDDADLARQFYDDAAAFTVGGRTYYPASEAFVFVEMLALMKADAARAVGLVGGVTALIILCFARSVVAAAVILLPTAAGLLFTLALMAATGLPLSIINMVILPSLVGIAVDNGIHIFRRFQESGGAVMDVMATTGRAATVTTLTTLIGFGGLVTASMGGLRSMGVLALIGFSVCLLLTWTLLPALLLLFRRRLTGAPHREGTVPS
ncbi:efflux RND transporter permease subunit [Eilatimonas milleporae]|uniref:Putative RND superfamily exporter protein n=1 Tax=Eilatimonas milleporae TaxID=911205 RepID=A0A3M0CFG4_9PROT|nr:MMPL family transporter [Eilatimonas milleporae]RMB07745.1 putative RND superfamily exporter protein [Eilatimonas milleporae]